MQQISTFHLVLLTIGFLIAAGNVLVAWMFHMIVTSYSIYKVCCKKSSKLTNVITDLPGISIIKPLTDVDPHLEKNLETFFRLNYPRYEVLFCIQDHNQQILNIIERLQKRYPHIESRIFIGSNFPTDENDEDKLETDNDDAPLIVDSNRTFDRQYSSSVWKRIFSCGNIKSSTVKIDPNEIKNPKIANMLPGYENAQFPFVLISDSGIMMREDALYDMYTCMDETVGLVHQLPFTSDRNGFMGSLEKIYFGTQQTRMYVAINLLGINCVTGMSCLIRKQCLDKAGGLRAFGDFIAEDYYMSSAVTKQGWKIRLASFPALQNPGDLSMKRWTDRMIRWCKLRIRLNPMAYFEPCQECFSTSIFIGLITNYFLDWNILVVAACHALVWFILDYMLLRITQGGSLPFKKSEFAIAWLTRELASYYIYFKAFTGSAIVQWRGKSYRLGSGTRAELIESPPLEKSTTRVPLLRIDSAPSTSNHSVNESMILSV